ncbi:MAG: VacB/RNase II family 3'-5' exoribonuclease [Alphaproteobacteria bacterium]|nr:VacB/RNase II family 3'-5' exoribonuclease [Alphaproteobacteria bacterium]
MKHKSNKKSPPAHKSNKSHRRFKESFHHRDVKSKDTKTPAKPPRAAPTRVVGIIVKTKFGWGLETTDRRDKTEYIIRKPTEAEQKAGELVAAEVLPGTKKGRSEVRITHHLGDPEDARNTSLIAIHTNGIPVIFSEAALREAEAAEPVSLSCHPRENGDPAASDSELMSQTARRRAPLDSRLRGNDECGSRRTNLRSIPLVTIDGPDARDFDDAVFAEPDKKGWHIVVAIADVAHYVRPASALDKAAYERGNSTYFPDRVVPMLPEKLSNDLCSLRPDVERACMAVHMWIDGEGELTRWQFVRGVMKSRARLTYEQVQAAMDGKPDKHTAPLLNDVIKPLYGAYGCLMHARLKRGTLELDLPERKVEMNKDGSVRAIATRQRLDSHKLIEEFMILANVAAAAQLENKGGVCLYRIHDKPAEIKLESLREFLGSLGINLVPAKQLHPRMLTHVLELAAGGPHAHVVNEVMLRSQAQAVYSPANIGHFGLALAKYAHFTSPIRRYADLIVHRGLIRTCKLGKDGLTDNEIERLEPIGEHISTTERRSATAERDAIDRFTTLYLADKVGTVFPARISGVARFGLFASLDETGADGIIPFNALPRDFYHHDEMRHALVGQRTKRTYQLGMPVNVRLEKADKLTGSMSFEVVEDEKQGGAKRPAKKHGHERPRKRRR